MEEITNLEEFLKRMEAKKDYLKALWHNLYESR